MMLILIQPKTFYMKTIHPKLLLLIFAISFCVMGCPEADPIAYTAPQTITITLTVDTTTIRPDNLNASCSLKAVYSSDPNNPVSSVKGSLECFTIKKAMVGDLIVWKGQSKDQATIIDINSITRENNSEIFKDKTLLGAEPIPRKGKVVQAKIIADTNDKDNYKYEIEFNVRGSSTIYKIDPKIKVGSLKPKVESQD